MINVAVPLPSAIRPGDVLTVVGNFGGTLSNEAVLSRRRVPAFEVVDPVAGEGSFLESSFESMSFDADRGGGSFEDISFAGPSFAPSRVVDVDLEDVYGYGTFSLAVVPQDALGQQDAGAPTAIQVFIAEPPLPIERQSFSQYDGVSGTVELDVSYSTLQGGA